MTQVEIGNLEPVAKLNGDVYYSRRQVNFATSSK
jgi:hypothetical protein